MRKIMGCALAFMLVFALAACGSSSSAGTYKAGTYTATANGMGTVTVKLTVDADKITAVDLDLSGETETIGQAAGDQLKQQVITAQSAEIDGVSGATVTSTAVKTAVADCLSQAKAA
jgi:uncharacterized protein with FMN-binding domain